ncbi:MAG: S41 family peptidase [Planctomycetaceae bacterium]
MTTYSKPSWIGWGVILLLLTYSGNALGAGKRDVGETPRAAMTIGAGLEQEHQWKDAVDHYKAATEKWPEEQALSYGLRRTKIQFAIERRYTDDSYRDDMLRLSKHDALELYDSILQRIRANYVEDISTTSIVAHGTESLWLALSNTKFVDANLYGADPKRILEVKEVLHKNYWNKPIQYREGARQVITEVCDLCEQRLGLKPSAVVLEYVFGTVNCLDDYTSVLTPDRFGDLQNSMKGEFVGIGIVMEAEAGKGMQLISVLPDSPASEAGLHGGDSIVAIDSIDCRNMTTDEAASMLAGVAGSELRLEIQSGRTDVVRSVRCKRRRVEVKSVPVAKIIDTELGIGYIQMTGFQETTSSEMLMALHQLQRQGMKSLIWDVRGNPGGLLEESARILDLFIADGLLVSTAGRVDDQNKKYTAHPAGTFQVPLVLLIDGNSASASEIVAGAVRDHQRGTIVGRKTYGKWSVQSIYPVRGSTGLRLTTAHFYSPLGQRYPKVGLKPDVEVEWPEDDDFRRPLGDVDPVRDHDVRRALEVLKSGRTFVSK